MTTGYSTVEDINNMYTVKNILVEAGEECRVDIDDLHNALLNLPAEKYLDLYRHMTKMISYYYDINE